MIMFLKHILLLLLLLLLLMLITNNHVSKTPSVIQF
jgi:hypothetical protein